MEELTIRMAAWGDAWTIQRLAHETWWPTYGKIIPHGQIRLMLEGLYTAKALQEQMEAGQQFVLALRGTAAVGFAGFRHKPTDQQVMRIEKLYIHPDEQGKGTGKALIDHLSQLACAANIDSLELNVNKQNPARAFYEKLGFSIIESVQIPYDNYVLDDYVMRKPLCVGQISQ